MKATFILFLTLYFFFGDKHVLVVQLTIKKEMGKEKKVKGNGKEDRSQEQDDRFMVRRCDVETDSVRCPQIQVLAQLLSLGKLNSLRFSLRMC